MTIPHANHNHSNAILIDAAVAVSEGGHVEKTDGREKRPPQPKVYRARANAARKLQAQMRRPNDA